jgi:hypothetical protein
MVWENWESLVEIGVIRRKRRRLNKSARLDGIPEDECQQYFVSKMPANGSLVLVDSPAT